jgi:hypothetical protein
MKGRMQVGPGQVGQCGKSEPRDISRKNLENLKCLSTREERNGIREPASMVIGAKMLLLVYLMIHQMFFSSLDPPQWNASAHQVSGLREAKLNGSKSVLFVLLRQGLAGLRYKLASHLRSSCLHLLSTGIIGMCHHAWIQSLLLRCSNITWETKQ